MSAVNALLAAIRARLAGDAVLSGLIGPHGFRDRLLPRPRFPCVVPGSVETRDYSTATEAGAEHFLTLEVWAEGEGRKAAETVAERLRVLLHDAPLALSGAVLVSLLLRNTRSRREPKTKLFVVELSFRAVTE